MHTGLALIKNALRLLESPFCSNTDITNGQLYISYVVEGVSKDRICIDLSLIEKDIENLNLPKGHEHYGLLEKIHALAATGAFIVQEIQQLTLNDLRISMDPIRAADTLPHPSKAEEPVNAWIEINIDGPKELPCHLVAATDGKEVYIGQIEYKIQKGHVVDVVCYPGMGRVISNIKAYILLPEPSEAITKTKK